MVLRSSLHNEALPYIRQPACLQLDAELPPFCSGVGSRSSRLELLDDTAHNGAEAGCIYVIFGEAALQCHFKTHRNKGLLETWT